MTVGLGYTNCQSTCVTWCCSTVMNLKTSSKL